MPEPTPPGDLSTRPDTKREPVERGLDTHVRLGREIFDRNKSTIDRVTKKVPEAFFNDDFYANFFRFHTNHRKLDEILHPDQQEEARDTLAAVHAMASAVPFTLSERMRKAAERFDPKFQKRNGEQINMGILNEPAFKKEADLFAAQITENPELFDGGVAFWDTNYFGQYNDIHPEHVGDDALRNSADAAQKALRPTDQIGRLGGDEFAALIKNFKAPSGNDMTTSSLVSTALLGNPAERVRLAIPEGQRFVAPTTTVTVGYSVILPGETGEAALIRASDAKKIGNFLSGKNRAVVARPDIGRDVFIEITDGAENLFEVVRADDNSFAALRDVRQKKEFPVVRDAKNKAVLGEPKAYIAITNG